MIANDLLTKFRAIGRDFDNVNSAENYARQNGGAMIFIVTEAPNGLVAIAPLWKIK